MIDAVAHIPGFIAGTWKLDPAHRVSFSATTTIDRNDFGVSFNAPIPRLDHAMLLSDSVAISLDVEAVLQSDSSNS